MKLNLQINNYTWAKDTVELGSTLTTIAQAADSLGFGAIALADHLWSVPPWMGPLETPAPECYTTLAFMAASTSRIELVALATPPHFRYPGMLAKIISTLDVLSKGRTWLGIGAGDFEDEAVGLGMPWPSVSDRFEMLEETVQICLGMWQNEYGSREPYNGRQFQLDQLLNSPQSLNRPHPPILIAGSGAQ